jgi:hypothetical protein
MKYSTKLTLWIIFFCSMFATTCFVGAVSATQTTAGSSAPKASQSQPAATAPRSAPAAAAKSSTGNPSSSDIAAAKASGKVWVNTESGVYHKGGRWYGKTKQGKFMTEAEAKAAGYKAAAKE